MACTSLTDLPNELLALIVCQISTEDRLSLAHLSRRLNHVALSYQLYEKHIPSYSSFGTNARPFSDLRHLGLYLTSDSEPPFQVIELAFTSKFDEEMEHVQRYLDTIRYDPPAFHIQFLARNLCDRPWEYWESIQRFSSFCKGLVRWKCLSLAFPSFQAYQLDWKNTMSFDVPVLTTLQSAAFDWPYSHCLAKWFVQCINASPIDMLCLSHQMVRYLSELKVRNLRHMKLCDYSVEASVFSRFISRHAATLQSLDCPSFFIQGQTVRLKSVPHLTSIAGPISLLVAVLSRSEKAFPSRRDADALAYDIPHTKHSTFAVPFCWPHRNHASRLRVNAHHIDRLTVTEPWLVPKEKRDWLYRLFPNLMGYKEIWGGEVDFGFGSSRGHHHF
ncbi:uncharacterized protein EV420DRAFT_1543472 [Desarmillaria tabescens]|uniref:F-box domain-containing protein n=1 Tax=Armillaria tabescens TaxID=1929756 RepID=A0AA39KES0_ARMTA|nr:uncharacterized protein EV420DRAFT_1543472 [Desarmillaria tabescens]KAK0458625.1 hypothetical protein EV420DRAFT_1543472 [Desarmillaria tabescens]